jgi:sulfatase modifying factor 1
VQERLRRHDLHGGIWTWTASAWKRDTDKPGLVALRGGNGTPGELVGRCANGRGVKPTQRIEDAGVRCCAGEPNTFEVVLEVTRGEPLRWLPNDVRIARELDKLVPEAVLAATRGGRPEDRFTIARVWVWHPLGNEELVMAGGCAHPSGTAPRASTGEGALCGVLIGRIRFETASLLAWVPSDWWTPTLSEAETPRELFLHGGDRNGAFRKRVSYAWGRIVVGEKERKLPRRAPRDAHP